jgi:hypothetical protein
MNRAEFLKGTTASVSLVAEASDEERRLAIDAGFAVRWGGFGVRWGGFGLAELALSGHLDGVRYSAAGFTSSPSLGNLRDPTLSAYESRNRVPG